MSSIRFALPGGDGIDLKFDQYDPLKDRIIKNAM